MKFLAALIAFIFEVLLKVREQNKNEIEAKQDDDIDSDEFFNRPRM